MTIFDIESRFSDSPFVERVWRAHCERPGAFTSIAASCWELVVTRHNGKATMTMRGPETRATPLACAIQAEWVGIYFKPGCFLPQLPVCALVDGSFDLPEAPGERFWLHGVAWQFPTYENAATFVARLVRAALLVCDPIVAATLRNRPQALSPRSVQRHFLHATGLTHGTVRQIERARYAALLLRDGRSIPDVTVEAGYSDQAHLTRSLRHFIGQTPAQLSRTREQLSLLFKTAPLL